MFVSRELFVTQRKCVAASHGDFVSETACGTLVDDVNGQLSNSGSYLKQNKKGGDHNLCKKMHIITLYRSYKISIFSIHFKQQF